MVQRFYKKVIWHYSEQWNEKINIKFIADSEEFTT